MFELDRLENLMLFDKKSWSATWKLQSGSYKLNNLWKFRFRDRWKSYSIALANLEELSPTPVSCKRKSENKAQGLGRGRWHQETWWAWLRQCSGMNLKAQARTNLYSGSKMNIILINQLPSTASEQLNGSLAYAMVYWEDYDEDERDDDAEDDELRLHVLVPHPAAHPRALLPEISSLQQIKRHHACMLLVTDLTMDRASCDPEAGPGRAPARTPAPFIPCKYL